MEKPTIPYLVLIKCDDGTLVKVLYEGSKEGLEEEIKDYMFQEWYELQPDITQYKVVNLFKEPNADPGIKVHRLTLQEILAKQICAYSNAFEFVGY
jgi:hypothetical protein